MATLLVDWLNDGTIPQNKTAGNWTPSAFNTGKFRFTLTFAAASSGSPWRPASLSYWGILTTNEANGSGIWLEYNPSGTQHRLLFVAADGVTNLAAATLAWGVSSAVTVTVDQSSATAGAATMTLAGASSGNGTSAGWTRASVFSGTGLYFGGWGSGGFQLPPGSVTTSDIDDGNDAVTRTAAGTVAGDAVLAATRTLVRAAAGTIAVAAALAASRTTVRGAAGSVTGEAALAATATGGGTTRTAAGTVAGDATLAATRTVVRGSDGAVTGAASMDGTRTVIRGADGSTAGAASLAMTIAGAATFGPGVRSSAINPISSSSPNSLSAPGGALITGGGTADADGRTPVAVDTQATGSAIYYAVSRPAAVVGTAITDNKGGGNPYTELHTGTYGLGSTVSPHTGGRGGNGGGSRNR